MLEQLFGSKTRVKLLKLFLTQSNFYYIRELVRLTNSYINSTRRELKNLLKIGIIKEKNQNRKKYFTINKNFILYPELKILITKSRILLKDKLKEKLEHLGQIRLLILTGFFVDLPSQTDILIVGKLNRKKLKHIIESLEKEIEQKINYTIMSFQEFRYRSDLTDNFLYNILENKKIVLINKIKTSKYENKLI
jgi:predicted oxidoreductase